MGYIGKHFGIYWAKTIGYFMLYVLVVCTIDEFTRCVVCTSSMYYILACTSFMS